jgi:topoisomerase-4 subunit B
MTFDMSDIQAITPIEAIRRRPAMYFGPLDDPALFNRVVQDSLCITVDECLSGHCSRVTVEVRGDHSITVRDFGRGLPMTPDDQGRPLAQVLLTELFACRAFKQNPKASECCDAGLVPVNALSEWFRVRNFREQACWSQAYERGSPLGPFQREPSGAETGVEFSFRPDPSLFGTLQFNPFRLAEWFVTVGLHCEAIRIYSTNSVVRVEFDGASVAAA